MVIFLASVKATQYVAWIVYLAVFWKILFHPEVSEQKMRYKNGGFNANLFQNRDQQVKLQLSHLWGAPRRWIETSKYLYKKDIYDMYYIIDSIDDTCSIFW